LAARDSLLFANTQPEWADRFRLLEARSAAARSRFGEVSQILASPLQSNTSLDLQVRRLILLSAADLSYQQYKRAQQKLAEADRICALKESESCTEIPSARGQIAMARGKFQEAHDYFLAALANYRSYQQPFNETGVLSNLGWASVQLEKFDQAIDWFHAAQILAAKINDPSTTRNAAGNLGWCYYELGDSERALEELTKATQGATDAGDTGGAIDWLEATATVYRDSGQLQKAADTLRKALALSTQINREQNSINEMEDLAHISVESGQLAEAKIYIDRVTPMIQASSNGLDQAYVSLAQGKLNAARKEYDQAEQLFEGVSQNPASQPSMRFGAQHELARLYESKNDFTKAEAAYNTTLATFESTREEIKNDDSKLPFLANATAIYDDYIHFLITQGKSDRALLVADQSRARTLAQDLGADLKKTQFASIDPQAIARKANSTLLFYWLGPKQSYLWAVTQDKTTLLTLPSQSQIAPLVERYRKALLTQGNPLDRANSVGFALYKILVAPAESIIQPGRPLMILADGPLSQLNFETLLVPASATNPNPHYLIEDLTLVSAPSLAMLAAAMPSSPGNQNLLLIGDAVSADESYPRLQAAALEMSKIKTHFATADETVVAGQQATPTAYLKSKPSQYAYIHFVAHGVASRTEPLASAIILSRPDATQNSFKLYAREIMQHHIDARLVTISACYGTGTRAYVGEGLVGLSWAFLRAGAHNTIGALWEASDDSSPRLMDALYQGIEEGQSPAESLRNAKLALLHSTGVFRKPFYWAPFQIYTRL
jgi:CHAT domain-containing protein